MIVTFVVSKTAFLTRLWSGRNYVTICCSSEGPIQNRLSTLSTPHRMRVTCSDMHRFMHIIIRGICFCKEQNGSRLTLNLNWSECDFFRMNDAKESGASTWEMQIAWHARFRSCFGKDDRIGLPCDCDLCFNLRKDSRLRGAFSIRRDKNCPDRGLWENVKVASWLKG